MNEFEDDAGMPAEPQDEIQEPAESDDVQDTDVDIALEAPDSPAESYVSSDADEVSDHAISEEATEGGSETDVDDAVAGESDPDARLESQDGEAASTDVWLASEMLDEASLPAVGLVDETEGVSEDEIAEEPQVQYRDPVVSALVICALSLVVVLLASTLGLYMYLSNLNRAPRTAPERDIAATEVAAKTRPKELKAQIALAYAYTAGERYDDALNVVAKASKLPNSEEVDVVKADVLRASGRYKESIKQYDKAVKSAERIIARMQAEYDKVNVKQKPTSDVFIRAYFGRALAKKELKDFKGAIADLELAVKEDDTAASLWLELGGLYEKQGDTKKAVSAYTTTLKYIPDDAMATEALQRLQKGD